jgi:hypothetical protein
MARGNHGQKILQDDRDRHRFPETLGEACMKTGFRIHACVLMGNYYHLLLQTPEGNLVAGMKVMHCGSVCGGAAAVGEWAFGDGPLHPGDAGREPGESAAGAKTASAPAQPGAAANSRRAVKQTG